MQLGSIPNCSATSTELCLLTLQSLSLGLHFDGVSFLPMRCVACVFIKRGIIQNICEFFLMWDSNVLFIRLIVVLCLGNTV